LKSAAVALIGSGTSLSACGGRDSVGAGDSVVVVVEDIDGTGKGGEDEDDDGEGANEHLGLSS
jgi:hypothetical protein